ncbi:MAG: 3-phosphoshikimate 1-carboxyvinyltransferase [Oscillospiraceae bacterium]|jgi:3-phosphoshikimate 1-carboxyvinyltransferase|nr:3-phosphoshikimate 1-carboxyvinyltransferase [Oscillospiraceae bacterium]
MNVQTLMPGAVCGAVEAIASKSDLHRQLIALALSGEAFPPFFAQPVSEDITATARCLQALKDSKATGCLLDCGESGSTLRFLLPVTAALGVTARFEGGGRLPARPLEPLLSLLRTHGCTVEGEALPLLLSGHLLPGEFALPGNISSQYVTGLLFALPLLGGRSRILLQSPLESAGYVRMTLQTLSRFGVEVQESALCFDIPGKQLYRFPASDKGLQADGCWSSAAFWLAAGALAGDVRISGLNLQSAQPDRAVLDFLRQMGADISIETDKTIRVRQSTLRGIVMDAADCPDLVPIMAVVMSLAQGESRIINAARLRLKESDRLHAMAQSLNAMGAKAEELPEGLVMQGVAALRGANLSSFGDHRIAMALAVAALRADGSAALSDAQVVGKSYPGFWETLRRLKKGGCA